MSSPGPSPHIHILTRVLRQIDLVRAVLMDQAKLLLGSPNTCLGGHHIAEAHTPRSYVFAFVILVFKAAQR